MIKSLCATLLVLCNTTFNFQEDFTFNSNKEFIQGVKNCAVSYNSYTSNQLRIPIEIVVGQAVLESDWGKSRFAVEGNNLYGIRTYNLTELHLKPLGNKDANFGLKIYPTKCLSVVNYIETLQTHHSYVDFRKELIKMWTVGEYDIFLLTTLLYNYSEDEYYAVKLQDAINYINERNYLYGRE